MMIHLSKTQAHLVQTALESYQKSLRQDIERDKPAPGVMEILNPTLFQLDLLITWFDRQREMRSG